jgi:two-component system response regulator MprA
MTDGTRAEARTRLMLVEDDRSNRRVLAELFEFEGYEVTVAADGLEALALLGDPPPALILLDIMMPRMDGRAFIEELGRRGLRPRVSVLATSARRDGEDVAREIGAEGYLAKPYELEDLLGEVARLGVRAAETGVAGGGEEGRGDD